MKRSLIVFLSIVCFIQLGCDGGFEKADFAINLEYPEQDSKCEKGEETENSFVIPFEWTPQGNLTSYVLILNGDSISINDDELEQNDTKLVFRYPVKYNTDYIWMIKSDETTSKDRSFRTPVPTAEIEINNVPLAVKFGNPTFNGDTNSMTVTFTWEGQDNDQDGNLKFDAYIHNEADISTTNKTNQKLNTSSPTEFTILNFDPNRYYYLLIVAKDNVNEAHSILKFKQF